MKYNLSSSQADRINYDDANAAYFNEQIVTYLAIGGDFNLLDRLTFDAWYDPDQEDVDDRKEATARAWATFQRCVKDAQR